MKCQLNKLICFSNAIKSQSFTLKIHLKFQTDSTTTFKTQNKRTFLLKLHKKLCIYAKLNDLLRLNLKIYNF